MYGETNRFPMYINSAVQCIRYWLKLLQLDETRIPFRAYRMLFELDCRGKKNWVTDVRLCLYNYGFGYVRLNQGVGSVNEFIRIFRQRLIDCRWQNWNEHIQNSDRFDLYRSYGSMHELKTYLVLNMDRHFKIVTTRFRMGVSCLATHYFRYRECSDDDLICPLCKSDKEDEVHFVFCCPVLRELRDRFIPPKYCRQPCAFKLTLLLSSTRHNDVRNLSLYLDKAFKLREIMTS